ncbi:hypothetical protein HYW41_03920 [Candidatus Daviesbacteria bacterium]|nr:hypothetical protein [Candidatus Daviesbacteria bacterium]
MKFISKRPHYEYLKTRWDARHRGLQEKIWIKHKESLDWFVKTSVKHLALGSLGGLLFLTAPHLISAPKAYLVESRDDILKGFDENVLLAEQLGKEIPKEIRPLNSVEESRILQALSDDFGFEVVAEIDGIRLSRNYGLIGGEQHLYRYPGDNLYAHTENAVDFAKYGSAGIAPGLSAWGYFSPSKVEFKEMDKLRERYYLAIQTFLVPGYAENVDRFRDFFKYRKMLIINPKTGQAVVAVIADSGPAEWTGKHLGGSPEVIDLLGLAEGSRKGAVLYFFVDDPKDRIPLGSIQVRSQA